MPLLIRIGHKRMLGHLRQVVTGSVTPFGSVSRQVLTPGSFNEPTGMTRLLEHRYTTIPDNAPADVFGSFATARGTTRMSLVADSDLESPPSAMELRVFSGLTTGGEAGAHFPTMATGKPADGWQRVYIRKVMRVVGTTFEEAGVFGAKWIMLGSGWDSGNQQNILYLSTPSLGINNGPLQVKFSQQNLRFDVSGDGSISIINQPTPTRMALDAWHTYEALFTCNDLGLDNGRLQVWANNVVLWDKQDCVFRLDINDPTNGRSLRNKFAGLAMEMIPSSGSFTKTRNDFWRYGHLYVSASAV